VKTIAILYCDPRGVYSTMPDLDLWDESRDARRYAGPHPVVAHPPCARWSALRHLAVQDTADCGPIAVEQVRHWGGVLEHPAHSKLWTHCGLPFPGELPDVFGGRTFEVHQVEWGHVARKKTWLYVVGCSAPAAPPFPGRAPTHWCGGGRNQNPNRRGPPIPPGIKAASSQLKNRTPPAFAELLVAMARSAK